MKPDQNRFSHKALECPARYRHNQIPNRLALTSMRKTRISNLFRHNIDMHSDAITQITAEIRKHPKNKDMEAKGYVPIFSASTTSRIVLIGQAPGIKAQESQKPWNDASGRLLREWLGVTDKVFYDSTKIALIPMDFYYPGKGKSGDLPPRNGFAALWHKRLREVMPKPKLTILIGQYSQAYYLPDKSDTLTETVRNFQIHMKKGFLPLPHPSPRNRFWLKNNPWFETDVIPVLQQRVKSTITA